MRVNIKNNEITSVEFLNVDEVIEFIQKFNKDRNKESDSIDFNKIADEIADKIIDRKVIDEENITHMPNRPISVWYQNLSDPYPYTITSATK